ncbi:AsnC family transcriptional regulator [Streptomyces piniterrae]|uniref:AsnC family transcriptional regulator n=2 Tax=Streptomyces piniterrae TaxID=2571125 RepID=A0A4U0NSF3_9ACTN|nr:AsnC family transcriptional regulator [Streptomyces piniterrae]TJZ57526.1 AsnC family transcriptional regulator [Streptomyces piniterrae]
MLDTLDRALIHALHIDGRAPFSRIAGALGVSPQTVARRYSRLRTETSLRVVGLADPHRAGQTQWMVRLTAAAGAAQDLAQALGRRPDTSWVKLCSGGTEIFAIVHTPTDATADNSLLLRDIPRTNNITAVSAHCLLHTYLGGPTKWRRSSNALSEEQKRLLCPSDPADAADAADRPNSRRLSANDDALLTALQKDGRASHAELARATGWSPVTVARRLADLQASGGIFFDVEVDAALFGANTWAMLWMSVRPAHLEFVATTLAGHDELAFVAATTGPTNLVALALCSDPADLHRYLVQRLGSLDAVQSLETTPVMRNLKAASPALSGLGPPRRPSRTPSHAG